MKPYIKMKTLMFMSLLLLPVIIFQGCGSKGDPAPSGAKLVINPPTVSLTNINAYGDVPVNYVVTLLDSTGSPIPDTAVVVTGSFANPVTSSTGTISAPRYQFWGYPNANANPSNIPVNSGFTAVTDKFGNYAFSIQIYSEINIGGTLFPNVFTDSINVSSGGAFVQSTLAVTAQ
jgi:hypothetical protein